MSTSIEIKTERRVRVCGLTVECLIGMSEALGSVLSTTGHKTAKAVGRDQHYR